MNVYPEGSVVRIRSSYLDANGNLVDPQMVYICLYPPSHVSGTYQYGVNPELLKDSTGTYHLDVLTAGQRGLWIYIAKSAGDIITRSDEQEFLVK